MAGSRKLVVEILGDAKGLAASIGESEGHLGKFGSAIGGMAKTAAIGFAAVGVGAIAAAKPLIDAASDLSESMSKVDVVFGESAQEIQDWSKTAAKSFGQSRQSALEAVGTYGNLFQAFGLGRDESAKMSKSLVELAADLASFNNTSVEEALQSLQSGLSGETEPLKKYGIAINDDRLKTEALRLGLIKTTKEALTPAAKAQASYALIMKDTTLAQGDFARTSGGAANQSRIMAAQFQDLKAKIGAGLLPVFTKLVSLVNQEIVPAFTAFVAAFRDGGDDITSSGFQGFLEGLGLTARKVFDWLKVNVPPVLAAIADFVQTKVIPALQDLGAWVESNLLPSLQKLWASFAENILPVIRDKILPVLAQLAEWFVDIVLPAVGKLVTFILGDLIPAIFEVIGWVSEHLGPAFEKVGEIVIDVKDKFGQIVDFIRGMPAEIADAASGMWDGIKEAFRASINWIIDKWNQLEFGIPSVDTHIPGVGKVGGFTLGTPTIQRIHTGGRFRAPNPGGEGLAWLRDGERVSTPGIGGGVTVVVQGSLLLERDLLGILQKAKRQGMSNPWN